MKRLIFEGQPTPFVDGDSVLVALLRAGQHPTGGGCLCLAGDCPHCLATVDGVSYVRTCQVAARPSMVVNRHPERGEPALPTTVTASPATGITYAHCDVAVIGLGESGALAAAEATQAGQHVISLDAKQGQEVVGIYAGPLVVARTAAGMLHVHAKEVVVATGAAEIQPVAPGNDQAGIVTARAAQALAAAGVDLGRVVAIGTPPQDLKNMNVQAIEGQLLRFEGNGHIEAVVVGDAAGEEQRYACDTVSVGLGLHPRDPLLRMGQGLAVRVVGEAARPADIPPCPLAGTVCTCTHVTVDDLQRVWDRGFHEMELVKRSTLAGTGTCQGSACLPHLRSFLKDRGGELQQPFTARPVTRQLTMGEAAAGAHHRPTPRTALDAEHRSLGAYMDRIGSWWRPQHYGNPLEEYWAVREAVSVGDVSTLGKMRVSGPDALQFLERLYPTKVAGIAPGRSRYVLLLDERGYVFDDGLILCEAENRYVLTFTSGGASAAEMWLRDWADSWGLDVRILVQTQSLGAINVTGPLATELLLRAGLDPQHAPKFMQHVKTTIADVPCHLMRLSFTGEISYELHHPAQHSVKLWRRLLALGRDLGIRPHGIETLQKLRLEKGHVIVGQDTDFDTSARRIDMDWAVKLDKPDFVGRQAVVRTNAFPLDKQLVGLEMDAPDRIAPFEGECIWNGDEYAGYLTSSTYSPVLGKAVMLAWLRLFDGALPNEITVNGRVARRVPTPFYDPEGHRARA